MVSLPKPEEVAGQAVKKISYCGNILSKNDKKYKKENLPEKGAGLDVKKGAYCYIRVGIVYNKGSGYSVSKKERVFNL